jgi:MscS family membrane protein
MDRIFFDNRISEYIWVIAIILFVLILNRFISKYLANLVCRLFTRIWKDFDKKRFADLIVNPLGTFLVITVSIATIYRLNFPGALKFKIYKYPIEQVLLALAIIIQLISLTWLLLRIIDYLAFVLEKRTPEGALAGSRQLIVFFRDFLKVILGIIGLLLILKFAFGYNISSLLTGLSIVGAAIALALRESLENLIASFVIFFDKPFTAGDSVKVHNISGAVERIGLRSTRIRTTDKTYVTVPNKQMVDSILDNISRRSQIRGEINLFICHDTPTQKIEELSKAVHQYLHSIPEVSSYNVLLNDIRVQGSLLFIEFFTAPIAWSQFTATRQKINYFILQTMEQLEVRLAEERK